MRTTLYCVVLIGIIIISIVLLNNSEHFNGEVSANIASVLNEQRVTTNELCLKDQCIGSDHLAKFLDNSKICVKNSCVGVDKFNSMISSAVKVGEVDNVGNSLRNRARYIVLSNAHLAGKGYNLVKIRGVVAMGFDKKDKAFSKTVNMWAADNNNWIGSNGTNWKDSQFISMDKTRANSNSDLNLITNGIYKNADKVDGKEIFFRGGTSHYTTIRIDLESPQSLHKIIVYGRYNGDDRKTLTEFNMYLCDEKMVPFYSVSLGSWDSGIAIYQKEFFIPSI